MKFARSSTATARAPSELSCMVRSTVHMAFMLVTVIPWATLIVILSPLVRGEALYGVAVRWVRLVIRVSRVILGIENRVNGLENLPKDKRAGAILLAKHQSAYETFLIPVLIPHPAAYVFKRELLFIPFFGWALGRLDMVHIDRSQRAQAFAKVVEQGKRLLGQGIWIIMFPEGTRVERGQRGSYKTSGARLAVQTGVPVIPIAVTSGRVWPRKAFIKRPGIVDVSIGAPISSAGRDPDELMGEVEEWIEAEMRRLDPEAYT